MCELDSLALSAVEEVDESERDCEEVEEESAGGVRGSRERAPRV